MKLLLDTHVLLWVIANDSNLPAKVRNMILDEKNDVIYSLVSLWEVEIKHELHPDAMSLSAKMLAEYCDQSGFQSLSIRKEHIYALACLQKKEFTKTHKDPFDRMLICQASTENMLLITHDARIAEYDEPCILKI